MTTAEFKKVGRILKELYKELEEEFLEAGGDIFGEEYKVAQSKVREALLAKMGFTIEEYREAKDQVALARQKDVKEQIEETQNAIEEVSSRRIPTDEDIETIAKKYVVPPVITNQIVKETVVEKPTIVKETKVEQIIEREEYDDKPLLAEIGYLNDRIDNIKVPEPVDVNKLKQDLKEDLGTEFGEMIEKNINILEMPNFRKLGMGLQAQIDDKLNKDGTNSNLSYLQFNTSATPVANAEGLLQWNSTDGTLDLGMQGGNITQQIGQELFIKVINKSGSTINNGTPVYFSGRQGNRPKIIPARSDAEATSMVMGITTEDIANNDEGYITTFGYVRQIKTNYSGTGDWGTTWAEGDKLYVSKTIAGQITNVEPTVPHHSDIIGEVAIVGGAGIGSIFINIQRHKTLEELSNVDGSDPDTTGDLLTYSSVLDVWERNAYNITDYLTISDASSTYVPYTGATADVDLGLNSLTANEFYLQAIPLTTDASTATSIFFGYDAGSGVDVASSIFMGTNAGIGAVNASNSNFFGTNAGYDAIIASYSNFFGAYAGYSSLNASSSNFFGPYAGYGATTGYNSNFFGDSAGFQATDAYDSNFFGLSAGYDATSASGSNFFGINAGYGATSASSSNFFGNGAGYGATGAWGSNFFGLSAGDSATGASSSNFFGSGAGYGATGASDSNFFGSYAGLEATEASSSNFFGYNAGYQASYAASSNFFGTNAGIGATIASYSNFFGGNTGTGAVNASNSNFFGFETGAYAANANNAVFIGYKAGYQDTVNNLTQYPDGSYKSSIVIGDYAGTGGYSDSITIGKGTKNSAANQANIGNVLFIEGIYALKTTSSTPITTGKAGIGISPTAKLTIAAGSATAGTAPVKLTAGTCMTVAEQGAIEYCGSYFHATPNTVRKTITLAEDVVTYEDEMISNLGDLVII